MQLRSRDGIACDLCGTTFQTDFMYYSWTMRSISVHGDHIPPIVQRRSAQEMFSIDVCAICYSDLSKKIIVNNASIQSGKRRPFVGTLDDIGGQIMKGTYSFYYCDISRVNVKMSGQPNICTNCNHKTYDNTPCTKCQGTDFIVPADLKIEERILEISLSQETFINMRKKAETIRKVAGEWATKT